MADLRNKSGIKAQSMAKGFAVLSVASILVKVLSLFFIPIIRKLMGGSAGYQVYYSANQVFAFVYVLATAGLPVAISKMVTEFIAKEDNIRARKSFKLARSVMIILGAALTVVLMLLAKPLARSTGYPDSWLGIMVIAPNIFLCSVLSAYRGYLQGLKNMTPTALSQVVEQIVHLLVSIICILILRNKGIVWAVAGASFGTVAGSVVALLIVFYFYKKDMDAMVCFETSEGKKPGPDTNEMLKILALYSIPITLSSAIQYGGNLIDVFIVKGRLISAGLEEIAASTLHGDLSAARQLINVPTALVTALCVSTLPIISGLFAQKKLDETTEKANYSFRLCFTAAVPCAVAMCVFAKPIYQLLGFGDNYKILMYMSMSVLLLGVVHLQGSVMQSVNLLYYSMFFIGISVIVKAIFNYILIGIPGLNIYGAILSTYISYSVPIALNDYILRKKRGIKIDMLKTMALPFVASAAMLLPSVPLYIGIDKVLSKISPYFGNLLAFGIAAVAAIITYFVVMKKTGGIKKEDIESISPKLAKMLRF